MRFLRESVLPGLLLIVVFAMAVAPVAAMIDAGLHAEVGPGPIAKRSLAVAVDVLTSSDYQLALRNAAALAGAVTLWSLAIGVALGLILGRTDIAGRAAWERLVMLPLYLSPFAGLMAWIALASPGTGFINRVISSIAEISGYDLGFMVDIWSFSGAALVMTLCFSPLVFLFTVNSLRAIDPALEEAALMSGASALGILWKISLPMCRSAIMASGLLVFALSAEIYTIPGLIGSNAGFATLPWRIFEDATAEQTLPAHAAAAATLLLAMVLIAALLRRVVARRGAHPTLLGGNGRQLRPMTLGGWRYPALGVLWLFVLCADVLPAGALLLTSLMKFTPGPIGFDVLTLKHYLAICTNPAMQAALLNTLLLAVLAAVICTVLGLAIGACAASNSSRLTAALGGLAMLPLAVPGLVYGLGLNQIFRNSALSGSIWLLLCAFAIKFLPYGVIIGRAGLLDVTPVMTDSARLSGAGPLRITAAITLKLLRPALMAALIFVMLSSVRELSASVLLASQDSAVLSVLTWHHMDAGDYQFAAAIGVVQTLILLALAGLAQCVFKLRLDRAIVAGGGR